MDYIFNNNNFRLYSVKLYSVYMSFKTYILHGYSAAAEAVYYVGSVDTGIFQKA